jgi:hypothetical protein
MINFNIAAFLKALQIIRMYQFIAAGRERGDTPVMAHHDREFFIKQFKGDVYPAIAQILEEHGRLDSIVSDRLANKLLGLSYATVNHELQALDSDIVYASEKQLFYHYPREKGLLVLRVQEDWAETLRAFPSSEDDVKAAVDCYALGHNHASIYHCMMVLERGLPALAKKIGAKFKKERPTWKDMTDAIRASIDRRRSALMAPPKGSKPLSKAAAKKERDLLEAAGEAAIEFKFF